MRYIFTILLFFLIIAFSCHKKHMEYITFSYNQTFCADPWKTGSTDSLTVQNVIHHLDSLRLYVAGVWIKQEFPPEACAACTCKTGKVIRVTTFKDDEEYFAALGFH